MAGGTGGAKLACGLSQILPRDCLTVIANTGDDFFRMKLRICPDIDSLIYRLAGIQNTKTGWGIADDTFFCLEQLQRLGAETWFRLGDKDLAMHLFRHQLLSAGRNLTDATTRLAHSLGVHTRLLPMCDEYSPTYLETDRGRLHMQEYFVRESCQPTVRKVLFNSRDNARVSPAVREALGTADGVIIGPSNPFISIAPILEVPGMREEIAEAGIGVTAISPIVGGRSLKGPTARMMTQLGYSPTVLGVADFYANLIQRIVIDPQDAEYEKDLRARGLEVVVMETVMRSKSAERRVAAQFVESSC